MQAVVLTLSGKNKGICLAVYYPEKNRLYRLVSDGQAGELPMSMKKGLNLLDVIEFTPVAFHKNGPQCENIQINMNTGIRRVGRYGNSIQFIYNAVNKDRNTGGKVFGTNFKSLKHADFFRHSLELVRVSNLRIEKQVFDNRATGKASFMCGGLQHEKYSVTDFDYDIRNKNVDCWPIGNAILVVSIPPEPYYDKTGTNRGYYKFISAIYEL